MYKNGLAQWHHVIITVNIIGDNNKNYNTITFMKEFPTFRAQYFIYNLQVKKSY